MSLATSCPSCGTVFKVVEDQLKVSEGWVRCGHCHDVFNALEGLFDLERRDSMMQGLRTLPGPLDLSSATMPLPAPAPGPGPAATTPPSDSTWFDTVAAATPTAVSVVPSPTQEVAPISAGTHIRPKEGADPTGALPSAELGATEAVEAPSRRPVSSPKPPPSERASASVSDASEPGLHSAPPAGQEIAHEDPQAKKANLDAAVEIEALQDPIERVAAERALLDSQLSFDEPQDPPPAFVLDAERRARWSHPVVRGGLALGSLMGTLLLAAQFTTHHRDRLAATCDSCRAPLVALAGVLNQPLQPPVMLEAVEVENAVLTHPPGSDGFRLTVQVRNHSPHEVAAPHMELSLTDVSGALLIRRVFSPMDFQQPAALGSQAESSWTLEFQTPQKGLAGYTVAAFFP